MSLSAADLKAKEDAACAPFNQARDANIQKAQQQIDAITANNKASLDQIENGQIQGDLTQQATTIRQTSKDVFVQAYNSSIRSMVSQNIKTSYLANGSRRAELVQKLGLTANMTPSKTVSNEFAQKQQAVMDGWVNQYFDTYWSTKNDQNTVDACREALTKKKADPEEGAVNDTCVRDDLPGMDALQGYIQKNFLTRKTS
jgi:hypothetical protein